MDTRDIVIAVHRGPARGRTSTITVRRHNFCHSRARWPGPIPTGGGASGERRGQRRASAHADAGGERAEPASLGSCDHPLPVCVDRTRSQSPPSASSTNSQARKSPHARGRRGGPPQATARPPSARRRRAAPALARTSGIRRPWPALTAVDRAPGSSPRSRRRSAGGDGPVERPVRTRRSPATASGATTIQAVCVAVTLERAAQADEPAALEELAVGLVERDLVGDRRAVRVVSAVGSSS